MSMYIYCIYPRRSKSPKQLPNCQISVVLIVLMVSCVKPAFILISYHCSTWIEHQKNYTLVSDCSVYNKNVSSECNLTAEIEPVQDKPLKLDNTCMVLPAFSAASSASLRFNLSSISSFCLCFSVFTGAGGVGVGAGESSTFETKWVTDWLLINAHQFFFCYIMMKTCYFSMRWWCLTLVCTRPKCIAWFLLCWLTEITVCC